MKCLDECCNKEPCFGIDKPLYCAKHKTSEMRDLKHKKCKEQNCNKRANHGVYKPEYCAKHKTDEMTNLVSKKCKEQNCNKIPSYGIDNPEYCFEHKLKDMTNLVSKKCKEEGCIKQSSYGVGKSEYCAEHKKENTSPFRRKCKVKDCSICPSYGNNKIDYCIKHKKEGMVCLVVIRKCKEQGCDKNPYYGKDKAEYCVKHKTNEMKSFHVIKKCIKCNLFIVSKRPYLCSYCNPLKRQKTKENEVEKLLTENKIKFIKDKHCATDSSCNKYRPDFLIDRNTYFLIIECDEDAHNGYDKSCELIRMNNICYNLGLPCVFLRYNPDNKSVSKVEKEKELLNRINYYIQDVKSIDKGIEIEYLFY